MTHEPFEPSPTRLDVTDLVDSPGATRQVELDVPALEDFEIPLTTMTSDVEVDGVLESLVDGVLLRGTVRVDVQQTCSFCVEPVEPGEVSATVADLFSDPATAEHPEDIEPGFTIDKGEIDIDALIRDALAANAPMAPKCRPDCAGLCPTCGINRNEATCDCADEVIDDRWAALTDLNLGG